MLTEYRIEGKEKGMLRMEYLPELRCALLGTADEERALRQLTLVNESGHTWRQVAVTVTGPMMARRQVTVDCVAPGAEVHLAAGQAVGVTAEAEADAPPIAPGDAAAGEGVALLPAGRPASDAEASESLPSRPAVGAGASDPSSSHPAVGDGTSEPSSSHPTSGTAPLQASDGRPAPDAEAAGEAGAEAEVVGPEGLALVPATDEYLHLDPVVHTHFRVAVHIAGDEVLYLTFPLALIDPKPAGGPVKPEHAKQRLWERKLLDLSLRNNLLNVRPGRRVVPLLTDDIGRLEDRLRMGRTFALRPRRPQDGAEAEPEPDDGERLDVGLTEAEYIKTVKELYRMARVLIEENGANALFLSVGMLRWYESEKRETPRYAPLLLLPVSLLRHSLRHYVLRARDEETMLNVTLVEMMRQLYDVKISGVEPLPTDEHGVDVAEVMHQFRQAVRHLDGWEVLPMVTVGIYSFTKFVMWNDLHTHGAAIGRHPLVSGIITGTVDLGPDQPEAVDAREMDQTARPSDFALPVDVDSSQLEAVIESGRGRTFILYGPPGTGKSQTITCMIANALYQGRRVLFVAEKKAALEVVERRLAAIGLDPYCLELHSNKADRKSLLAQLEQALGAAGVQPGAEPGEAAEQAELRLRHRLIDYAEALHRRRGDGLSLYDHVCRSLTIDGPAMEGAPVGTESLTGEAIETVAGRLRDLDTVAQAVGCHPAQHPLRGLYPRVNTVDNQRQVEAALSALPAEVERVRRRQAGWWNRCIMRRTFGQLMARSAVYRSLAEAAELAPEATADGPTLAASADRWLKARADLRRWYHYATEWHALRAEGAGPAVDYYMAGRSGAATAEAFRKGMHLGRAEAALDGEPALRAFRPELIEADIDHYRTAVETTKGEARRRLAHRLAEGGATSDGSKPGSALEAELALLRRRIASKGRACSIRRILDDMPTLLPRLCPCMLMSPLSVAQYLPLTRPSGAAPGAADGAGEEGEPLFDLVIFDEASQIPTSEAVGAIARGRAVVVVGDARQMPPTTFFQTDGGGADDDTPEASDDLESILDDCRSLAVPSRQLSMHYRSAHESLIAFSNAHYYDGGLTTFPSVDDQVSRVTFRAVDGTYDYGRTRCNQAEGEAIVAEVIARLSDPGRAAASIGIVAFSKAQSDLIEDLLAETLAHHKDLERLSQGQSEPIFVKNLENVQGDERDVILFSVGYGPDPRGKVSMNFGPLNQQGGERRLNVAVSRARREMVVFSTLQPEQIDLTKTNALGVAGLKAFLLYARDGALPEARRAQAEVSDSLTRQVAEAVGALGYGVRTGVGRSTFRIDVAVVDPRDPERYLCGIMCDGGGYYATPTVRDREVVKPGVLQRLGWPLLRVWSVEWLDDRPRVVARLKAQIEALLAPPFTEVDPAAGAPDDRPPAPRPTSIEAPTRPLALPGLD